MAKAQPSQDEIDYALSTLEVFKGNVKSAASFLQMPAKVLQAWASRAEQVATRASRETLAAALRPRPPAFMLDADPEDGPIFVPAPEVTAWMLRTFVVRGAALHNPAHEHLEEAKLGVVWTNVFNERQGKFVAGTAEMPYGGSGSRWSKARADFQLRQWFGPDRLDFLITLYSGYADECNNASFCSLSEHEMYHCGQKADEDGDPIYTREGGRIFVIKGHDAEEHVGIVERYGVEAAAAGVKELVAAASRKPILPAASIAAACGTCRR